MSLQRRLTLFFILIVMLPLLAAGWVVRYVVVQEVTQRTQSTLDPALALASKLYTAQSERIEEFVGVGLSESRRFSALLEEGNTPGVNGFLEAQTQSFEELDFLIALGPDRSVTGAHLADADFASGFEPPDAGAIAQVTGEGGTSGTGFAAREVSIQVVGGGPLGSVIGGFWLDDRWLADSKIPDVGLSVVADRRAIAATQTVSRPIAIDSFTDTFEIEGLGTAQSLEVSDGLAIVAWVPQGPIDEVSNRLFFLVIGLLVLASIVTSALAYLLARSITRPLEELSAGAEAISTGRLDHRIPAGSTDEVGQVAIAFNRMADRLGRTINELQSSRDLLQTAVQRVGETLRSTHDMRSILESILYTASDAVGADAAVLWRFTPNRNGLVPVLARGVELGESDHVPVGSGVAGHVAERGTANMLPSESGGPKPTSAEPDLPAAIVAPLYSRDRITAVLGVYRRDADNAFTRDHLDTVGFLVEQGGVAMENVTLHEEAQRLSITDGLTSVWNRRYLQMQFRQVLATSLRFNRPFSVLMLDLDLFKRVNDTYGHQRGDAILIEFSQRVNRTLREVDTFARYGGEEFICLLSETDVEGALTASEKIKAAIKARPFGGVDEDPVNLTVSIGVACYPDHGDSYQSLVGNADRALYRAKQEGRDRVVLADGPAPNLKVAT